MSKLEKKSRYNFYEQLRLNKIKKLCELRDILIQEEEKNNKLKKEIIYENEINNINTNNNNNNGKSKTIYITSNSFEKIKNDKNNLIKKIIIENEERIRDNKLERIKAINNIELANIVEFELDKNLYKMELKRQMEKYNNEIKNLKKDKSKKSKTVKNQQLKNCGNNKPIINKYTTFNENLISFHVAKKIKEYDIYQKKLEQRMEKIEMKKKKKNETIQMKKKMEEERTKLNLKKSNDLFNRKQKELIKKMQMKDLITSGIKKMINEKNMDKREKNMKKFLSKKEHINKMRKMDEFEREQKYNHLIMRENTRGELQNMKNRIYSSRIYRINDIQNEQRKNIYKIQKILKKGEGDEEENLDILMEEFPDNSKIAEIIKQYQIKKNNLQNNYKIRQRLYSSQNPNININLNNIYPMNNYISRSIDKKRIFIYANNKKNTNDDEFSNIKNKNELIKKEERRINNTNPNNNIYKITKITNNISIKEKSDIDQDNESDLESNLDIAYEHEIEEKVRNFKVKVYKDFLKKIKVEKNNEILRNKQLEIISDMALKRNLENQFSRERALVDLRLKKESEIIKKKTKDYESNLRYNFQQKQQRYLNQIKDDRKKKLNYENV